MTIIAIDGGSATGKGTLCEKLAEKLDFGYLDTGALYRSVGYEVLQLGLDPCDAKNVVPVAERLPVEKMLTLQDESAIRNEVVGKAASQVSALPAVRQALFDLQRRFALNPVHKDGTPAKGAILDGRDIGTVICPDADFKVFLIASSEIRAQRRYKELQLRGNCVIYETVLSDIRARDKRDEERAVAPSKPADDAYVLDTSDLTPDEVFATVMRYIENGH